MRQGFRRSRGAVELRLEAGERELLAGLLAQVLDIVRPLSDATDQDPLAQLVGISDAERPDDPMLLRLFPDAYGDDAEASSDFRRFTEDGLRRQKAAHVSAAVQSLAADADRIRLTEQQERAWLMALNDLRLAYGTRLGVSEDDDPVGLLAGPQDDANRHARLVYDWLTWLQSTLLAAMRA